MTETWILEQHPARNRLRRFVAEVSYTVWDRSDQLIYVGMAGRGETVAERGSGPFGRLASHASGRRSGDQFCVYVCDRLVLPTVRDRIDDIAAGGFSLDGATRQYVRTELGFRMVQVADGREALRVERLVQRGALAVGHRFSIRSLDAKSRERDLQLLRTGARVGPPAAS